LDSTKGTKEFVGLDIEQGRVWLDRTKAQVNLKCQNKSQTKLFDLSASLMKADNEKDHFICDLQVEEDSLVVNFYEMTEYLGNIEKSKVKRVLIETNSALLCSE